MNSRKGTDRRQGREPENTNFRKKEQKPDVIGQFACSILTSGLFCCIMNFDIFLEKYRIHRDAFHKGGMDEERKEHGERT